MREEAKVEQWERRLLLYGGGRSHISYSVLLVALLLLVHRCAISHTSAAALMNMGR